MLNPAKDEFSEPTVSFALFSKFVDLYNFSPTNLKGRKDKNWSPYIYQVLTNTNGYGKSPSKANVEVEKLLKALQAKIEQRMSSI